MVEEIIVILPTSANPASTTACFEWEILCGASWRSASLPSSSCASAALPKHFNYRINPNCIMEFVSKPPNILHPELYTTNELPVSTAFGCNSFFLGAMGYSYIH